MTNTAAREEFRDRIEKRAQSYEQHGEALRSAGALVHQGEHLCPGIDDTGKALFALSKMCDMERQQSPQSGGDLEEVLFAVPGRRVVARVKQVHCAQPSVSPLELSNCYSVLVGIQSSGEAVDIQCNSLVLDCFYAWRKKSTQMGVDQQKVRLMRAAVALLPVLAEEPLIVRGTVLDHRLWGARLGVATREVVCAMEAVQAERLHSVLIVVLWPMRGPSCTTSFDDTNFDTNVTTTIRVVQNGTVMSEGSGTITMKKVDHGSGNDVQHAEVEGRGRWDWKFEDLKDYDEQLGPIAVELFASEYNRHYCACYCTMENSASDKCWSGRFCYENPPYEHDIIMKCLQKALHDFEAEPVTTRFLFVLPPKWETARWWGLVSRFKVVKLGVPRWCKDILGTQE
ncbi:hypothetical protein CYMTET_39888 [Cymbomonas tetramitiformis]|uniref:Uncharacterized protein n=1 Tax=Cymbomonas tetramitiformis TaxID=36881 RepID=A0AAE0F431_9CHLO|nr:hypothetical protein CYMTET_39888 [Cymbomonas tetramitiformis]